MISQHEQIISFSIISANKDLIETLAGLLKDVSDQVRIATYYFDASFIEAARDTRVDVIFADRTGSTDGWNKFHSEVRNHFPDALLIFILSNEEIDLGAEMISTGVYDIISNVSIEIINPLVNRIIRDLDDHSSLRFLAKEKDLNDHIVNCSRSMLSIINRDYVYEKVNATFCNAQNIDFSSIIGKSLAEIWGAETFKNGIKDNIDLCFTGNTVRYEANFNTPLFGNRFYEVVFRPIKSEEGFVNHLLAETFDITDLKLSQNIVNEMEEEFKILETNLPIGFLRCEADGTIIHANKAFIKIIGCDDEKNVAGLNIKEFYCEKELFEIHLRQLKNEQIKTFGRVPMFTCSGTEIACRIYGFVVSDKTGNASYIDFAFEDFSRELMLENRLLQAQKLETIGALAGGLAHDFNNILATIFGYSELLLEEVPKNSVMSEKIIKIIAAITRARSLTNQILTFSRQVEQEKIPVNIYEVLKETIGFIESGKPENVELVTKTKDIGVLVYADPTQLFRVFLNLMTNAIQSMEECGGTLTVELTLVERNQIRNELSTDIVADEYVLIGIEDTGMGMDQSVMKRIFEPYFTTKEVGKGIGLGLSVVHGIVGEMEGEILVKSRKDKGSLFSLYLPVARNFDDNEVKNPDKNLLIITGNPYESKILSLALEKSGYKPEFASDMNKLRKILSEQNLLPDAIIYMDDSETIGTEDISFLYSENDIETPLILITDTDHYPSKEKLLNSGIAKQVLIKPVSLREINLAIQMSLA